MDSKFKVKPIYQKHKQSDLEVNLQRIRESEIFFIFGDRAYVHGCKKLNSETLQLIHLAKQLSKPFILCLDNSLPIDEQKYLRELCPESTQVFSFNPKKYSDMQLHKKMMSILNSAINNETIVDPFMD
jgi:hypothetical protein